MSPRWIGLVALVACTCEGGDSAAPRDSAPPEDSGEPSGVVGVVPQDLDVWPEPEAPDRYDVSWALAWFPEAQAVRALGDEDGDGLDDVLVSYSLEVGHGEPILGLFVAPEGENNSDDARATVLNWNSGPWAGRSYYLQADFGAVGDLTGDGLPEVAMVLQETHNGHSRTLHMGWWLRWNSPMEGGYGESYGISRYEGHLSDMAARGDLTGDGRADLALGYCPEGEAWYGVAVMGGAISGDAIEDAPKLGEGEGWIPQDLASRGDADGDGIDDLLVGGWSGATASGFAAVFLGPVDYDRWFVDADASIGGGEIASSNVEVAWTDGPDGGSDVLIGVAREDQDEREAGGAWVFRSELSGVVRLGDADLVLVGEVEGGLLGASVAAAGDVDGDGLGDILIGAPEELYGNAYLVTGAPQGRVLASEIPTVYSGQNDDFWRSEFGRSVAGAGDTDGDGLDDFLISGAGLAILVAGPG